MKTTKNILLKDIEKRKRRRRWLVNSLAVLGALIVFTLLGFVHMRQKSTVCSELDIQIEQVDGHKYLDEKTIAKLVGEAQDSVVGTPVDEINLLAIHKKISENSSVKEAHVYTTVDGRCVVMVKQRTPIARVFNKDGSSFYLDKDGYTMALSPYYTAKVPVFVGNIDEKMQSMSILERQNDQAFLNATILDDIYYFTQYVDQNEFWKAQVEHVHINDRRDFEIIPRVGTHKINVGSVQELDLKFKKLMAFYANTVHTRDLNQYSSIHVEYDGQVVCVKR